VTLQLKLSRIIWYTSKSIAEIARSIRNNIKLSIDKKYLNKFNKI